MSIRSHRSSSAAFGVCVALLAACGDERPPSTDAVSATMLPPAIATTETDADALPSTIVEGPCTPGDWVPCHMYYRDTHGRLQCPMSTALCRPDGKATYACGEWVATPEGPRPRDAGTEAEVVNE